MGSGQAASPDAGADVAQDGSSYGWKEKLQQRQMAAQAVSGGSASAVGGGSGSSGGSSDAFWYMRSDGQSTSLNYFIPIGVMLGLVTLACLFVGFWWRRRLERTRRLRAAEQPADPEQGGLPRCSLESEAGCPPHLPKIPVLIVCPDNKHSFGWQLEGCQLSSMPSSHSMHSEGSGSCASHRACCAGGKGGGKGGCGACSGCGSPTCSVAAGQGAGEAGASGSASPSSSSQGAGAFSPAASPSGTDADEQPGSHASQTMQQQALPPAGGAADGAASGATARAVEQQPGGESPPGSPASDPLSAVLVPHLAAALAAMPVAVVPIARRAGSRRPSDDEVWPPRPQPRRVTVQRVPTEALPRQRSRPPMYTIEVTAPATEEDAAVPYPGSPSAAAAAAHDAGRANPAPLTAEQHAEAEHRGPPPA